MLCISAVDPTHLQQIGYGLLSILTEVSFSVRAMRTPAIIDFIDTSHDCYSLVLLCHTIRTKYFIRIS